MCPFRSAEKHEKCVCSFAWVCAGEKRLLQSIGYGLGCRIASGATCSGCRDDVEQCRFFCAFACSMLPLSTTLTKFSKFTLQEDTISWWNAAIVQSCTFEVLDDSVSGQVCCMWGQLEPQELQRMSGGTSCAWSVLCGPSKTAVCHGRSTLHNLLQQPSLQCTLIAQDTYNCYKYETKVSYVIFGWR
jgi:hypothetical protein